MATDISLNVIKSTQESLGQFVKKPALSEKLLKKPPFRFLHDIITAVIKNTGFFEGLFTEEELVSENVKDRESKIAFLQKVVEVVNIVTNSSLSVRPSKIIAGLEPEKTNELLQKIGLALRENLNSKEAVEALTGSKKSKPSKDVPVDEIKNDIVNEKSTKNDTERSLKKSQKETVAINSKVSKGLKSDSNSKAKTNSVTLKDKLKIESVDKKISKKPSKNDTVKKSKAIENQTKLKSTKPNEIENKEIVNLSKMETDNEVEVAPRNEINSRVELKDIIDDDDDSTLKSQEINIDNVLENVSPPMESRSKESKEKTLDTEEKPIQPKEIVRPQSGVRRQMSSKLTLQKTIIDNNSILLDNETSITSSPFGQNLQSVQEPLKSIENYETLNNGSGDSRTRSVRTASSKKSMKKTEPVKATKSMSIESRSDADVLDLKSLSSESEHREQVVPKTTLRPPSVRPSSARPGAPRLKDHNTDVIVSIAEPVIVGKVHVIVENYDNQQEDDEGSVEVMQMVPEDNIINTENNIELKPDVTSSHGHLVQRILETQKELLNDDAAKVEIEWEYGARREREASYKEIESIRNGLQSLSRASNPLGKLMDYIQEDVEVMRQELMQWRDARHTATTELKHQQRLTEQQIQPLEAKLKQLEVSITEQTELIHTVKSNIHRNALKITKLIDGDD